MKKLYILAMAALSLFASCDKESEDNSFVTTYANIEMNGDELMMVQKGSDFKDPGCVVTIGGEKVDYETSGSVDVNQGGLYELSYSKTNADGYTSTATRQVVVYDYDNMEGLYEVTTVRPGKNPVHATIIIADLGNGYYSFTDFLGGYYAQGAGYGANYAAVGMAQVDKSTGVWTISLGDNGYGAVAGWGDYITSCDGTFDPDTKVFEFKTMYANYEFNVTNAE